ncbi:MAG TPA: hypothetical protein VI136_03285 [Verrucomicrobiae bacterium]
MPGSLIGEIIVRPILELVFQVAAYYVGCVVVPVVSLGRWQCEPLLNDVPRKRLRKFGLYHVRGQQVYLTAEATALVGLLFCLGVAALGLWLYFRT